MLLISIGKGNLFPNGMNPSIFSKGWIELVILNIKVGRFFASLKVSLPLTTSRRHRKWKLTRGEESDTDSGGESGGEVCSHLQFQRQTIFDEL